MFSAHSYHKLQNCDSQTLPSQFRDNNNSTSNRSLSRLSTIPEQPLFEQAAFPNTPLLIPPTHTPVEAQTEIKAQKPAVISPHSKTLASNTIAMKVKELRNWLSELGDKNQEHYHRFKSKTVVRRKKSSHKILRRRSVEDVIDSGNEKEDNCRLGIETKPSTSSTCPSSAVLTEEGDHGEDPLFGASPSYSSSSDELEEEFPRERRNEFYDAPSDEDSSREGVGTVTGKNHLALLRKQAPNVVDGYSASESSHGNDSSEDSSRQGNRFAAPNHPTLFRDQLLTKAELDAMSMAPVVDGDEPATLGEHLRKLNEKHQRETEHQKQQKQQQQLRQHLLGSSPAPSFRAGNDDFCRGNDDENTEKDEFFPEDESLISEISNDSEAPSIATSVLVSKMASAFLNNHQEGASKAPPRQQQLSSAAPRAKYVDPMELSFLRSSGTASLAKREALARELAPKEPTTVVGKGIRKFGGRQTNVERRKAQLRDKFDETKAAVFVKKAGWGQSGYGQYKRVAKVEKIYKANPYA